MERAAQPGLRLLLAACAAALGTRDDGELPALAAAVSDWDGFVHLAARHAVAPLVYRPLAAPAPSLLPDAALGALQSLANENARRNLVLTRRLLDAVDALAAAGIPALPIKGPVLAVSAYGDIAARQFGDLDIIVPRRDLGRARARLATLGYEPASPLAEGPERALMGADYHLPLEHLDAGVSLELHWALSRGGSGAFRRGGWAWRHARRVPLLGRELHALSWDALLVYLCAHGAKHAWERLQMVCDVAVVMRAAHSVDWDDVKRAARLTGARRATAMGVLLAGDLLGAAVPDLDWIRKDEHAARLAAQVAARLPAPDPLPLRDAVRFQLRTRERLRDAVAYSAHLLVAPQLADASAVALPPLLRPAYYVFRPLRLAVKYAGRRARSISRGH